jgi:hypothetical protein
MLDLAWEVDDGAVTACIMQGGRTERQASKQTVRQTDSKTGRHGQTDRHTVQIT